MSQNRLASGQFRPGTSGNPGGRPRGLTRTVRELVGDDGEAIVAFWLGLMLDDTAKTADRLEASRLLADRGWGKATLPVAAVEEQREDDGQSETERWPSPHRMQELAKIYREFGDDDNGLAYDCWAADALAAGVPFEQPVDPAVAPPPTVGRVARALLEQSDAMNGDGTVAAAPAAPAAAIAA